MASPVPLKEKLIIYQGATFARTVTLTGVDEGVEVSSARMQIRPHKASDEIIIELTTENGRISIQSTATERILKLLISDEDTAALSFATGVYDLEAEYDNGQVDRVLYGPAKLDTEVTR